MDVVDAFVEQGPVEGCAEFGSVVDLHAFNLEGQLGEGLVDELDGGFLVAARVGAQYP